jgi:hypothetical protein
MKNKQKKSTKISLLSDTSYFLGEIKREQNKNKKPWMVVTPTQTGSTLLVNVLLGFFDPTASVVFKGLGNNKKSHINEYKLDKDLKVIKTHASDKNKTHIFNIEGVNKISVIRRDKNKLVPNFCFEHDDILVMEYEDLLYKSTYNPNIQKNKKDVILEIAQKIEKKFEIVISDLQIDNSVERINLMDMEYEKIKQNDFGKVQSEFFGLHGNHRNRSKDK